MVDVNPTISNITSNINSINVPIKRQSLTEWIKNQDPAIGFLQETYFKYKDSQR